MNVLTKNRGATNEREREGEAGNVIDNADVIIEGAGRMAKNPATCHS